MKLISVSREKLGVWGGVSYFFYFFDERLRIFKVNFRGWYYLFYKIIHNFSNCLRYAVDSAYDRSVDDWVLVKFGEAVCVCVSFWLFQ
jgi:hypothetical protein